MDAVKQGRAHYAGDARGTVERGEVVGTYWPMVAVEEEFDGTTTTVTYRQYDFATGKPMD